MKRIFLNGKAYLVASGAALATAVTPLIARAEGEVAGMVTAMPDIDLSLVTSAGTKVFACIAVVVAIGLGFRLFKKA